MGGVEICDGMVWHTSDSHDWVYGSVFGRHGKKVSRNWILFGEAHVGLYEFKEREGESISLQGNVVGQYTYRLFPNKVSLYGEVGVGIGHITRSPGSVARFPLGNILYGAGFKYRAGDLEYRLGYQFLHQSSLLRDDSGLNTHGMVLTVAW